MRPLHATLAPKVSIISPCLNGRTYLPRMLSSVQSQTYRDWELVYIDDGSTDGSLEYMADQATNDPRIVICRTPGRQGAAASRNIGMMAARGRFIAFLDSDDWWLTDKLSRQLERMEVQGAAFSCTAYLVCDADERVLRAQDVFGPVTAQRHLLKRAVIGCLTVIFDRHALDDSSFRIKLAGAEDYVLWYEMLHELEKRGLNVVHLDEYLACYRVHGGGKSRNKRRHAVAHWRVYRQILGFSVVRSAICFVSYSINALYDRRPRLLRARS